MRARCRPVLMLLVLLLGAGPGLAAGDTSALYMASLAAAERAAGGAGAGDGSDPMAAMRAAVNLQRLAAERAFAGDTEGAIAAYDAQAPLGPLHPPAQRLAPELDDAVAEDAVEAIVAAARTRRVVILNEAHHVPMHRAFARALAARLRAIGYGYLACEAFAEGVPLATAMQGRGQGRVVAATGHYLRDPVFAGFVNNALADGWKLVAYEHIPERGVATDPWDAMGQREEGQARHLAERVFAADKEARVFIYAGYAHAYKGAQDGQRWMAERLRRMTGIEPLSVDTTTMFAHPDRRREADPYDALVTRFPLAAPFVLRAADGSHPVFGDARGHVDMQVVFPRYPARDGRPDWLRTLAGRSPRAMPDELMPRRGRRIVKAYRIDDGPDAVPADAVLVDAGKPAPALMLPPGAFRFAVEDEGAADRLSPP